MATNVHATLVLLEDRGVLIRGASGSGKSTLALALVGRVSDLGRFARLVGDDRIDLSAEAGRLLGRAAAPIRGLAEVHGLGPSPVFAEDSALVDLLIDLVPHPDAPRYQEGEVEMLQGCKVARLRLPARDSRAAASAVLAWLHLPPFL